MAERLHIMIQTGFFPYAEHMLMFDTLYIPFLKVFSNKLLYSSVHCDGNAL